MNPSKSAYREYTHSNGTVRLVIIDVDIDYIQLVQYMTTPLMVLESNGTPIEDVDFITIFESLIDREHMFHINYKDNRPYYSGYFQFENA